MKTKLVPQKNIIRRLKIIEGHLKKVTTMVEENKYCIDVLQQTSAVKNALKKTEDLILENHLHSCVIKAFKKNQSHKATRELLEVFKQANK